jgi:hypothetical protein
MKFPRGATSGAAARAPSPDQPSRTLTRKMCQDFVKMREGNEIMLKPKNRTEIEEMNLDTTQERFVA